MATDELQQLQREWRESTTNAITDMQTQLRQIRDGLADLRKEFSPRTDNHELRNRVDALEKDRAKIIGALIAIQALGSLGLWAVNQFLK